LPGPDPTPPASALILEDFESHTINSLQQSYEINDAWGANELTLDLTPLAEAAPQGQVLALSYKITAAPPDNYVGLEQKLPAPQDWSDVEAVQVWVRNDGIPKSLIFQWGEASTTGHGEVWKTDLLLQPHESHRFDLPLTSQFFNWADWSPAGNQTLDLGAVNYYGFFLHPAQESEGTVYLDSILLLPGEGADPPPPEPEEEPVSCQSEPAPEFQSLWQTYPTQLGCPTGSLTVLPFIVEESFEGGHLIWREDTDDVYVLYDRLKDGPEVAEGEWTLPSWKWDEVATCQVTQATPTGLRRPERGFGWLWCTHLGGPDGPLGWALDKETGYKDTGRVQPFQQGLAFKGAGSKTYALLNNGRFLSVRPAAPPPEPSPTTVSHKPTGFEPAAVFEGQWKQLGGGSGPLGYPL
jgi:hypothetical protein